jgi:hypothetical protein
LARQLVRRAGVLRHGVDDSVAVVVVVDTALKFRPADAEAMGDPHPDGPVEWEDNAISNTFAWVSYKFLPRWCQTPEHWTSRLAQYLFTDCPCCLLFRGIVIGFVISQTLTLMTIIVVLIIAVAASQ